MIFGPISTRIFAIWGRILGLFNGVFLGFFTQFLQAGVQPCFEQQHTLLQLLVVVGSHLLLDGQEDPREVPDLVLEVHNQPRVCFVLLQHWQQRQQLPHLLLQVLQGKKSGKKSGKTAPKFHGSGLFFPPNMGEKKTRQNRKKISKMERKKKSGKMALKSWGLGFLFLQILGKKKLGKMVPKSRGSGV